MNVLGLAFVLTIPLVSAAFVLAFMRLARGPSLADRVVALDIMAILMIGFIANYSVATGQRVFLDVAVVVALVAFLATVAFAYHLRRGV